FAHADVPLFLFHLLEFSDQDFDLDVAALNDRWSDPANMDSWSAMVIKATTPDVVRVVDAPQSGIYGLTADGEVEYRFFDYRRSAVETEQDGYFLRITGPGDWRYEGADLGILITRGRLMDDDGELNQRARQWLAGLLRRYAAEGAAAWSLPEAMLPEMVLPEVVPAKGELPPALWAAAPAAGAFKIL
ncbi:MAG TPA: hypothetical protein VK576_02335, partial [Thermoleophilia bacterium]|nr:hypothetical protein [Thermoleophilia bacterium]